VFHTGARPLSRERVYQIWRRALSKEVPCPQWANERAVLGVRKPLTNWLGRSVTPCGPNSDERTRTVIDAVFDRPLAFHRRPGAARLPAVSDLKA
jgi:hypothetical protein